MKNLIIKALGGYTKDEMSILNKSARQMLSKVPIDVRFKLGLEKGIVINNTLYEEISSGRYTDLPKIWKDIKTLLIIGENGSGKNFLAQRLTKNDKKNIFFGSSALLLEQFYRNLNDSINDKKENLSMKKYVLNNSFDSACVKFESEEVQDIIIIGHENYLINPKTEINIDEIKKIAFHAIKNDYNIVFSDEFLFLSYPEMIDLLYSCHSKIINGESDNQKLITVLNLHQVDFCFDKNGCFEKMIDGLILMKGCRHNYNLIQNSSFIKEYINSNSFSPEQLYSIGDFVYFEQIKSNRRGFFGDFVYREYASK